MEGAPYGWNRSKHKGATLRSPPDVENDTVNVTLSSTDYQLFMTFISTLRRIDGWCKINKAIGKWLLFGGITLLILMSQGLDAVRNLLGLSGKH